VFHNSAERPRRFELRSVMETPALVGWLDHRQQEALADLIEENRILRGQLRGRRLRLTDEERRRVAMRGQRLGRRALSEVATIFSPDTIRRWHRQLVARTWTYARGPGRRGVRQGDPAVGGPDGGGESDLGVRGPVGAFRRFGPVMGHYGIAGARLGDAASIAQRDGELPDGDLSTAVLGGDKRIGRLLLIPCVNVSVGRGRSLVLTRQPAFS
jgi:hypothetical protein